MYQREIRFTSRMLIKSGAGSSQNQEPINHSWFSTWWDRDPRTSSITCCFPEFTLTGNLNWQQCWNSNLYTLRLDISVQSSILATVPNGCPHANILTHKTCSITHGRQLLRICGKTIWMMIWIFYNFAFILKSPKMLQ